jgi:hypothetical protein
MVAGRVASESGPRSEVVGFFRALWAQGYSQRATSEIKIKGTREQQELEGRSTNRFAATTEAHEKGTFPSSPLLPRAFLRHCVLFKEEESLEPFQWREFAHTYPQ